MTTSKEFTFSRTFNAPRDIVWKARANPASFVEWWRPGGCELSVVKIEFKPGGLFHYNMKMPNGNMMWGRMVYREIVEPERIVFVNSFSDASGGITRAPFSATWPLEILNNMTFTERGGQTTVDLRGGPINPTDEERATFEGSFPSMKQGFGSTFDLLDEFLARG